jgi:chromosome segregation ATPase
MWWKKLLELVQDLYDLRRQLKGHDKRLDESSLAQENLNVKVVQLADRVLRLEWELQQTKEAHARDFTQLKEEHAREREHLQQRQLADRDNFRLQIENLVLRWQRRLPPPELPEKPDDQ